jgi:hypothetical protein
MTDEYLLMKDEFHMDWLTQDIIDRRFIPVEIANEMRVGSFTINGKEHPSYDIYVAMSNIDDLLCDIYEEALVKTKRRT